MKIKNGCKKNEHEWEGIVALITEYLEYKVVKNIWRCRKCENIVKKIPKKI